jgi:hypothetical protein
MLLLVRTPSFLSPVLCVFLWGKTLLEKWGFADLWTRGLGNYIGQFGKNVFPPRGLPAIAPP